MDTPQSVVTDDIWQRVEPLIPVRERAANKEYQRTAGAGLLYGSILQYGALNAPGLRDRKQPRLVRQRNEPLDRAVAG